MEMNPMMMDSQPKPRKDERGKVFIGGLSWDTTEETLLAHFAQFGEIIECNIMKNPQTGKSRGFGFVTYVDPAVVDVVLNEKPHMVDGRPVDAKPCNAKAAAAAKIQQNVNKKEQSKGASKVFIGGIPGTANEDTLKEVFSQFGTVLDCNLMYDPEKGRSRGFGFLTFETEESVDAACLQHYVSVNGKKVECKRAQPQNKNHPQEDPLAAIEGQIIKQITSQLQAPLQSSSEEQVSASEQWASLATSWNQNPQNFATYNGDYQQQAAAAAAWSQQAQDPMAASYAYQAWGQQGWGMTPDQMNYGQQQPDYSASQGTEHQQWGSQGGEQQHWGGQGADHQQWGGQTQFPQHPAPPSGQSAYGGYNQQHSQGPPRDNYGGYGDSEYKESRQGSSSQPSRGPMGGTSFNYHHGAYKDQEPEDNYRDGPPPRQSRYDRNDENGYYDQGRYGGRPPRNGRPPRDDRPPRDGGYSSRSERGRPGFHPYER